MLSPSAHTASTVNALSCPEWFQLPKHTHSYAHSCTHVYTRTCTHAHTHRCAHTETHIHKPCTHTEPQRPRRGSVGGRVSGSGGHLEARTTSDSFLPEVSPRAMPLTTSLSPPLTTQPRRSDVSIAWGNLQGLISGSASGKETLGPAKRCDHPCSCHRPPREEGVTPPSLVSAGAQSNSSSQLPSLLSAQWGMAGTQGSRRKGAGGTRSLGKHHLALPIC